MQWFITNVRFAHRLHNILIKHAIPLDPKLEYEPSKEEQGLELEHGYAASRQGQIEEGPYMNFVSDRAYLIICFPDIFGAVYAGESGPRIVFALPDPHQKGRNAFYAEAYYQHANCWTVTFNIFRKTEAGTRFVKQLNKLCEESQESEDRLPTDVGELEGDPECEEPMDASDEPFYYEVEGDLALKVLEHFRDSFLNSVKET